MGLILLARVRPKQRTDHISPARTFRESGATESRVDPGLGPDAEPHPVV